MCLGMRNGTTDMMKDTFSACCTGKCYMNVHVWLVLDYHGIGKFYSIYSILTVKRGVINTKIHGKCIAAPV